MQKKKYTKKKHSSTVAESYKILGLSQTACSDERL